MAKVTVFGSFVVDLITRSETLPQKGQTVLAQLFDMGPGGKGQNQAVQSHLMGVATEFICKLGHDELSEVGKKFWAQIQMPVAYLDHETEKTGCANICVDKTGHNQIAVHLGANNTWTDDEVRDCLYNIKVSDIFLTQAETNVEATELAIDIAYRAGVPVIYNPAPYRPMSAECLKKVFLVTPNETEAAAMLDIPEVNVHNCIEAAKNICKMGPESCIITLGAQGCCYVSPKMEALWPTITVEAVDTVGAGDSFNGALAAMLAKNYDVEQAIKHALAASAMSVLDKGSASSMKRFSEIQKFAINHYFI